jgi:hypothetical protein
MRPETATHSHAPAPLRALAASGLFVLMLIAALALWTVIPLGWIYIGSKVATTQFPSQGPYAIVAIGILTTIVLDAWLLGRLNVLYVRLTGTNRLTPMRPNWLRSMRDSEAPGTTTVVEAVLMASVLLAGAVFVAWFFLLAGSPLPSQ